MSQAHYNGREAFVQGKDWTDNPYTGPAAYPLDFAAWFAGWLFERQYANSVALPPITSSLEGAYEDHY